MSAGAAFREAVIRHRPLQIPGAVNAYTAMLAERTGFHAVYVSGSGVATASFGLPDLGITTMSDVVEDVRRISGAIRIPVLVDIDTGFGGAFNIQRTVRELEKAGAAAVHIEDQIQSKRCGHRPNKQIVSVDEMIDRISCAAKAKLDPDFVIMARTDAYANEGLGQAIARANAYVAAGADMIFAEAMHTLDDYREFCESVKVPVLANMTEFGKTPLFSKEELSEAGVGIILYPLSAFRAQSAAALRVYQSIMEDGHQRNVVDIMQTRAELYDYINYHEYETQLDLLNPSLASKIEEEATVSTSATSNTST